MTNTGTKNNQLVTARMGLFGTALALAGGLLFVACSGGPTAPAPAAAAAKPVAGTTASASSASTAQAAGASTCAAPKTAWCHVPDSQSPREICIDSAGVADHQQHPRDYPVKTFYQDGDGDGYGSGAPETGCVVPTGYVEQGGDCDDSDPDVNPGATEACDGKDNNCNGQADEGVQTTFYQDGDGDTYGGSTTQLACTLPTGYVERNGDCNDANAAVKPGATEVCDGVDNDCDGQADEACESACIVGLSVETGVCPAALATLRGTCYSNNSCLGVGQLVANVTCEQCKAIDNPSGPNSWRHPF